MLEWFKRRPECGNDCRTCRDLCPVQAIRANGAINLNECYHCLSCQTAFYDDQICPPLVARRQRRERALEGKVISTKIDT
jgi:NosR/NirI family nitrous oxide reductase transcriptional regulator